MSDQPTPDILEPKLTEALAAHGIELPEEQVRQLARYAAALWEVNEKINLTRHTDFERFVGRDVVDSLAFCEFLRPGERVLDVGTGGGVPGVLIAILRPDVTVMLCDSVEKKARAVSEILQKLNLPVSVIHGRAEDIVEDATFDTLVLRAVASLRKILTWFRPTWLRFERLLIVKGPAWVEERGEARHHGLLKGLALRKLKAYPMPGTDSESVLLQICPEDRLELFG